MKQFWIAYCTRTAAEEVFVEETKVGDVFYDGYNAEKVVADKVTHVIEYSAYEKEKNRADLLYDLSLKAGEVDRKQTQYIKELKGEIDHLRRELSHTDAAVGLTIGQSDILKNALYAAVKLLDVEYAAQGSDWFKTRDEIRQIAEMFK